MTGPAALGLPRSVSTVALVEDLAINSFSFSDCGESAAPPDPQAANAVAAAALTAVAKNRLRFI